MAWRCLGLRAAACEKSSSSPFTESSSMCTCVHTVPLLFGPRSLTSTGPDRRRDVGYLRERKEE